MIDSSVRSSSAALGRNPSAISRRTWAVSGTLFALLAAFYYFNLQAYWYETLSDTAFNIVYVWGISFGVFSTGVILWTASAFGRGEPLRRVWTLMGIGLAMFAVGDVIWTVLELVLGIDPYPSIADLFYMLQYPFFIGAVALAIRGYKGIVNIKIPVLAGFALALAALAGVHFVLLDPYIFPYAEEIGALGVFVSAGYPIFDVALMAAPAVTLALTVSRLGIGRFAWPWWVVALAASVFAVTDAYYSYVDWGGFDYPAILDIGWAGSAVLLAVAALVARDVCCVD